MKTGNTGVAGELDALGRQASMEPGHEDREYHPPAGRAVDGHVASMEPGHEDREYPLPSSQVIAPYLPQWSPVMKTGNTISCAASDHLVLAASMEPGHEDREYAGGARLTEWKSE